MTKRKLSDEAIRMIEATPSLLRGLEQLATVPAGGVWRAVGEPFERSVAATVTGRLKPASPAPMTPFVREDVRGLGQR